MGAGKSICGCLQVLEFALAYPGILALVGRKTYTELEDTTRRVFFEDALGTSLLDVYKNPLVRRWNESKNRLILSNGSEVLFRSLEDEKALDKIKSLNLGLVYVDEVTEIGEATFLMLLGRLRQHGMPLKFFGTTNPAGKNHWCYQRFIQNPAKGFRYVRAKTTENIHLPEFYVERLYESYPEEWRSRYIEGEWGTFEGQVFPEFDAAKHVVQEYTMGDKSWTAEQIPQSWPRLRGIDPGYRAPTCCLWMALSPRKDLLFYDELYQQGLSPQELAAGIHYKTGYDAIEATLTDPSGNQRHFGNQSFVELMAEHGIYLSNARNAVLPGILKIREYLHVNPRTGRPRMFIFGERCPNLVREVQGYTWRKPKVGADERERPVKRSDHCVDAARYICFSNPENFGQGAEPENEFMLSRQERCLLQVKRLGLQRAALRDGSMGGEW